MSPKLSRSLGAESRAFAAIGLLVLAFPFSRPQAQESGTLKGSVTTMEKIPLARARISVVGTTLSAMADTDGTFRIKAIPLGSQSLEVRFIGYASMFVPVQIDASHDANVEVTLAVLPIPLAPVTVTGDAVLPEMRRFAERRSRGLGRFFTREDIDKMEARQFTDILRRVPGMQLELLEGYYGPSVSVQTSRNQGTSGGRACPVQFYLNGVPFTGVSGMAINHFIAPGDIAAVEVYSGASQVPSEFNSSMSDARCGVVLVWTRISTSPSRSN